MRLKFALLTGILLATSASAQVQVPATPVGRLFTGWLTNLNDGDRTRIQQFIEKRMTWGKLQQELGIREMTGGFDVRKVEESSDTRLVVLAQERGPGKQFVRISMDVSEGDPEKVAGIRVQPAQPPAELAPRRMSASDIETARNGVPYRQFSAWLEALNAGDRSKLRTFLERNFPGRDLDREMSYREVTGGLDLRSIEQATPTSLTGVVQHREDVDVFARFTIAVDAAEPHHITQLRIGAIPRPAEFSLKRMSDAEIVAALHAKIEREVAADRFAGTILLAKNGKTLFSGAYGMADREKGIANTLDTRFRIGSMNKMFTAVAVLQLVQAGKLKLTDTLGKHVADYPNQDAARKVTIHHLLTHTGGTGDIFGPAFDARRLELRTLNDYVALYGKRALAFEPGSRWEYSNYGMLLLGVVIERVSKQSYYDYVAEHVYKAAGMTRSGSDPENVPVPGRSTGYMRGTDRRSWIPNTDTLPYRGTSAGGGYSTVGDLSRFASALMNNQLLDAEHTRMLIEAKVDSRGGRRYAYGFEDARKDGKGAIGHGGGAPGMNGDLRIYPHSGYVVAVLSNLDPPAAQEFSGFLDLRLPK